MQAFRFGSFSLGPMALVLAGSLLVGCSTDTTAERARDDAGADGKGDAGPGSGGRIYASVAGTNEVLVLDDSSHEQLSSIKVGEGPAIILATPDFSKLYTANWTD